RDPLLAPAGEDRMKGSIPPHPMSIEHGRCDAPGESETADRGQAPLASDPGPVPAVMLISQRYPACPTTPVRSGIRSGRRCRDAGTDMPSTLRQPGIRTD